MSNVDIYHAGHLYSPEHFLLSLVDLGARLSYKGVEGEITFLALGFLHARSLNYQRGKGSVRDDLLEAGIHR